MFTVYYSYTILRICSHICEKHRFCVTGLWFIAAMHQLDNRIAKQHVNFDFSVSIILERETNCILSGEDTAGDQNHIKSGTESTADGTSKLRTGYI